VEAAGRGGDGLGADLKWPAREGGAPTTPIVGGVAARPDAGGSEARGDEDGTDKRGPGVSGRARGGMGGCLVRRWASAAAGPSGCWAERGKGRGASGPKTRKEGEKKKKNSFPFSNDFPNFIFN